MKAHPQNDKPDFIKELEARQRNIWIGDQIRNSGTFYRTMWHGSPDAPLVQRIGAVLIGLFVFGVGIVYFLAVAPHSVAAIIVVGGIMGGWVYAGIRIVWNALFP